MAKIDFATAEAVSRLLATVTSGDAMLFTGARASESLSERAALLECVMEELFRLVRERQTEGVAWSVCQDLLAHLAVGQPSVSQMVQ